MSSLTPQQQAWLDMIAYAEGTDRNKSRGGYNILFGGGRFSDLTRHPDKVVKAPGIASAAAGRYQFMPDTWKAVSTALKLPDFSPAAQDLAALELIRRRGVDPNKPITKELVAKLAPEWASLPTLAGKSFYNQPVKQFSELQKYAASTSRTIPGDQAPPSTQPSAPSTTQAPDFKQKALGFLFKKLSENTEQKDPYSAILSANAKAEMMEDEGGVEGEIEADDIRRRALLSSLAGNQGNNEMAFIADLVDTIKNSRLAQTSSGAGDVAPPPTSKQGSFPATSLSSSLPLGSGLALKGAIITDRNDTGGKGIDFVLPGRDLVSPFKEAQVLKVVVDPRRTDLIKNPGGPRFYGTYVDLRVPGPTGPYDVRMAHFDALNPQLKPGQKIPAGTKIGVMGNTGSTTGRHHSFDFRDPGKTTASARVLAIKNEIASRLERGLPL